MRHLRTLILAAMALLGLCASAGAQQNDQERRETLISLYMVTVAQDLCGFAVSDAQAEALTKKSDDLEDKLGMSEDEADKIYSQIEDQMKKQKDAGLCKPDGEGAKQFNKTLETLGK